MKKLILTSILIGLATVGTTVMGQQKNDDYLGLPGDNLNLYAVMKLFQDSKTLEEFEKNLNDENSRINNLDLNGDGQVDYIRVIDNIDGDVHNIILQDAINEKETQDVAVFTVQRFKDGHVQIQLTGDEDLYGKNYIVEPIFDDSLNGQTPNPGYTGNRTTVNGRVVDVESTNTVEIATWPLVRFLFLPDYIGWHSSWYWGYYPPYWHPWHPLFWHYYYGYHYNWYNYYYGHYRIWNNHRYPRWNDYYYNSRHVWSPVVRDRIHAGDYRSTYSHPEQRREGEALYDKTHNEQVNRRDNTNRENTGRRNGQINNKNRNQSENRNVIKRNDNRQVNRDVNRNVDRNVNRNLTNPSRDNANKITKRSENRTTAGPSNRQQSDKRTVTKRENRPIRNKEVTSSSRKEAKTRNSGTVKTKENKREKSKSEKK